MLSDQEDGKEECGIFILKIMSKLPGRRLVQGTLMLQQRVIMLHNTGFRGGTQRVNPQYMVNGSRSVTDNLKKHLLLMAGKTLMRTTCYALNGVIRNSQFVIRN